MCDDEDEFADALDPRVQVELESLNVCTDEINRLEIQLDEANAQFRNALSESTQRLKYFSSRLGKCIDKSRPYYEAVDLAKKAQHECQKAAIQFQRAASLHATAKETIFLAEQKFHSRQDEWQFDTTWQDMLNHATSKVMEADVQRADSEKEHQKRAILFAKAEQNVQHLEQKLRSAITKSKPYFETKDIFQNELQLLKERVQNLQKAVVQAKERYAQALRNLEAISEQIHEKRKLRLPREPGVGAEELDLATLNIEEHGRPSYAEPDNNFSGEDKNTTPSARAATEPPDGDRGDSVACNNLPKTTVAYDGASACRSASLPPFGCDFPDEFGFSSNQEASSCSSPTQGELDSNLSSDPAVHNNDLKLKSYSDDGFEEVPFN